MADFPKNLYYQHELATTCHHLGYQLWDAGRLVEAEPLFRQALDLRNRLDHAVGRAQCHNSLGLLLRTQGRLPEAEQAHRTALALVQGPHLPPESGIDRWELARSHAHLGIVLGRSNRFVEAEAAVNQALALRLQIVADRPTSWGDRHELALTYVTLGWLRELSGQAALAEEPYRLALTLQEQLLAEFPKHPESWKHLAPCHVVLGRILHGTGRDAAAEKSFRAADQRFRQALERTPASAKANHDLAWFLATCPAQQFRKPGEAVALAKKAVELEPGQLGHWMTLGVAHYRDRNWQAALAALEKCLDDPTGLAATANFVLAMGHWQCGDMEQARRSFDRGVAALEKNNARGLEANRFRAEAADLLDIADATLPACTAGEASHRLAVDP